MCLPVHRCALQLQQLKERALLSVGIQAEDAAPGKEIKEEHRFCGYGVSVSKHQESGTDLGKHYVPDTVFITCRVFLGNLMRINVPRNTVASTDQTPQEPHQGKFLNYSVASTA